jgi:hypothetical protein
MREPYICPYCDQRSTRRWNLDVHIKRKHGRYSLGSSDRYMTNNPAVYDKSLQFGHATVADSTGDSSQPIHPSPVTSHYSPSPIYPSRPIMDDQRNGGLSSDAIQKIQELKALMNKYPRYHTNADSIIRLTVYNSINGDNTLLVDKLEQLRGIDRRLNGWAA